MSCDGSICPGCGGKGYTIGYGCPGFKPIRLKCRLCNETGYLSEDAKRRLEKGQQMRADRIARDLSLREEAKRLGIKPSVLSAMEHGYEQGK